MHVHQLARQLHEDRQREIEENLLARRLRASSSPPHPILGRLLARLRLGRPLATRPQVPVRARPQR